MWQRAAGAWYFIAGVTYPAYTATISVLAFPGASPLLPAPVRHCTRKREVSHGRQIHPAPLWAVLAGSDGRRDLLLALDGAGAPRAVVRDDPLQRFAARGSADVALAPVETAQGAGGGWRDRGHADRTAGRVRLPADGSRRGIAPRRHVARHLGPALGGVLAFPQESRPIAVDVGHAPQSRSFAATARALHDQFPLSRAHVRQALVVAADRGGQGRPVLDRSGLRGRPLRAQL